MSWTTNDATNDATSDAARGWEQTQVTSNKLANESPFLQANANSDMHRFNVQGEARFRDSSGGIYPEIQPVTVDKDGGRVTIDAFNRVIQMQDAAGRCFQFGYDPKSGELNRVYNEDGVWKRSEHHGKYTDEWKGEHKQKWHGEVTVNPDGYSFTQGNERVTFAPNGSRTKEYSSAGKVFYSDTITADGKHKVIDSRLGTPSAQDKPVDKVAPIEPKDPHAADSKDHGKEQPKPSVDANGVETRKSADGTTVIDRQHNTQLNYDREGRLTEFKDPAGRRVAFKDYDDMGKPHTIENQMGTWHKTGPDLWTNDRLNKTLHINVQVNKDGYTFSDLSGKKVTRNVDGSIVEEYRGLKTRTDINGKVTRQMIDGSPLTGNVLTGSIDFTVKKGDTKAGRLHISQGDFQVVHGRGGDVHAQIQAAPNTPIGALQDGLVVYSYNHDPKVAGKMEQRSTSVVGLSDADMAVINHYRRSNPSQDLVVMQCYDPKSKGVRYEIYAGLSLANAAPGDRVKAGAVLGKAGDRGYTFAARKGRVSGQAVELTL